MGTILLYAATDEPLLMTGDTGQDYTFKQVRQLSKAVSQPGVMSETDMRVTSAGAGQVTVAVGYAWVACLDTSPTGGGKYGVPLEAAQVLNGITSPASTTRRDQVVVHVYDDGDDPGDASGLSLGRVEYIKNASETTTPEAVPSNAELLAWVDVTTIGGLTITDKRRWALGLPTVSALPSNPVDGQEIIFQSSAMKTAGQAWHLRYDAGASTSKKWEFLGGDTLEADVLTTENGASTTYANLTTTGPSVTVPLAGDYEATYGATARVTGTVTAARLIFLAPFFDAAASDNDAVIWICPQVAATAQPGSPGQRTRTISPASAGDVVVLQYKVANAEAATDFRNRFLRLKPLRVG